MIAPSAGARCGGPNMRRAVILFPSGFTLGNLFFGVFAIIAASRGDFVAAGVYVLLGGICDALDGRVARATNAGTRVRRGARLARRRDHVRPRARR